MPVYASLEFRNFASFTDEERELLKNLTYAPEGKKSLFRRWLDPLNSQGFYAVLAKKEDVIIAWAAVNTLEGWKLGKVGVFVHPEYRKRGIAVSALDSLLSTMMTIDGKPEYLSYTKGMERLFRPVVERYEFKDIWLHRREYRRRTLEMEGHSPEERERIIQASIFD